MLSPPLLGRLVVTPHGAFGVPRPRRHGIHQGVDFAANTGDLVVAAARGHVLRVGFDRPVSEGGGGGGNYVILLHEGGPAGYRSGQGTAGLPWETGYMHLDEVIARVGDAVRAGEAVGRAGATGTVDGAAHLHFQVKVQGKAIDPLPLFAGMPPTDDKPMKFEPMKPGDLVALASGVWALWRWLR